MNKYVKHTLSYMALLTITSWIIGFAIFTLYAFSLQYRQTTHAQAIVVLTGGVDRLSTALDLLQQEKAEHLFISGVNEHVSLDSLFKDLDANMRAKIQLGYRADNTYENALETEQWLTKNNIHSVLLVTSFYHMPRSIFELQEHIKNVDVFPYPIVPKQVNARWVHTRAAWLLFEEYNKFLVVSVRSFLRRPFL